MYILLATANLILGLFITVYSWAIQKDLGSTQLFLVIFGGLVIVVLSLFSIRSYKLDMKSLKSQSSKQSRSNQWNFGGDVVKDRLPEKTRIREFQWGLISSGIFLVVVGAVFLPTMLGRFSIGVGFFVVLFTGIASQISRQTRSVKLFADDGNVLMETSSIYREEDCLVIKGKILGSMSTKAYLRPNQIWELLSIIPPSVIIYFPLLFIKGWIENRRRQDDRPDILNTPGR